MKEIRLHGRGGQGVVKASHIVVKATVGSGAHGQFIPFFGVERKGSPVFGFLRLSNEQIRRKTQVYEPDILIIFDDTLVKLPATYAGLKEGGTVIINSTKTAAELGVPAQAGEIAIVDATGETLPVLAVLNAMGKPWLASAYSFMLLLAFLTTAISCIGSRVSRLENVGKKQLPNDNARRFVISLVIILVCFGIAQFGLLNIIKKGYNAVGYLGIPFVIIPTLFIAPGKIRKAKAAMKASETK